MVNTFLLQSLVIDLLKSVNGLSKGYQQHGCLSIDCNSYSYRPVSYTHLDVYKRQEISRMVSS